MKKAKRILALAGAAALAGMYVMTLVFALSSNPNAQGMLMASVACTVIIPCLIYAFTLVTRILDNRHLTKDKKAEKTDQ